MTHEQKPESAEFRTRDAERAATRTRQEQKEALIRHLQAGGATEMGGCGAKWVADRHIAEAEARGAAEQRRKDAAIDPDDVTCALMDSQYVAGAKFGWNCGQDDDHASLQKMIEGRLRDRIEAGVSFSDRRKEKASAIHEQRRKDAEKIERVTNRRTDGTPMFDGVHIADPPAFGAFAYDCSVNVAALEDRVKELEGALKEAAYALKQVKDGERGGYNARNGKFVSLQMSDGERADIIHGEVTEDCERALEAVRSALSEGDQL